MSANNTTPGAVAHAEGQNSKTDTDNLPWYRHECNDCGYFWPNDVYPNKSVCRRFAVKVLDYCVACPDFVGFPEEY